MASKNSSAVQKAVLALLALWSVVSVVVIVVWATSPDLKGSARCRAELRDAAEKLEGAKVVFEKDRQALEGKTQEALQEQDRLKADVLLLLGRLNATDAALEESRAENVVLANNVTALQDDVRLLQQREANLTEQLGLREEHIEALQQNLTQAFHETESCFSLKTAAENQMSAAQSLTKVCESKRQYLEKQLQKCKAAESETPQVNQAGSSASSSPNSAAAPLAGIPALTLLVCVALHLMTCEYQQLL